MFVILAFIIKMPVTYTGPALRNIHSMLAGHARSNGGRPWKSPARSGGQLQLRHNGGNAALQDRQSFCILVADNQLETGQGAALVPQVHNAGVTV